MAHEDALHAMVNALYVGPQRDRRAPLLEVMVEATPPRGVHAT